MIDQETIFDRELAPIVFKEVMSIPTTILDGESHEDARRRRFQEEAAIDARILGQTLCWRCNAAYEAHSTPCPNCQAINGNVDPKGAMRQANGPQGYEP